MQNSSAYRFRTLNFSAPQRILVATDLTDCDYLIPYVVAQAKASNARVTLVHAVVPANSFPIEAGAIPYIDWDGIDRDARSVLLKMARQIEGQGVVCNIDLQHGFASDVVREALLDTGATRLIIGTHGRGKLGQFVLGSVANELLKTVEVPIFAVGPAVLNSSDHATPRKILHPVSLVGDFQKSVDFAADLARSYGAELTLLHVMTPDFGKKGSERSVTWGRNALSALVPPKGELGQPVQFMTVCGKAIEEILSAATRINADWIVLGIDADTPAWSLKDSMAYKVLAGATCPVCTIRHDPRAAESVSVKLAAKQDVNHIVEVLA
jgi:nucleotide-binding universal stress UspA family protein